MKTQSQVEKAPSTLLFNDSKENVTSENAELSAPTFFRSTFRWFFGLFLGLLFFLGGVFLGWRGGWFIQNDMEKQLDNIVDLKLFHRFLKGHPITPNICRHTASSDLNGAFREVDCLITFRRAFPDRGKVLDKVILRKFRALHKRLQNEAADWRTVARWKYLYQLGTRLYPVRNKQAANAPIPIYQVNGHHLAMPFWLKESLKRDIGPLFHLDTHNDMRAVPSPKDVLEAVQKLKHNRDIKQAWHTIAHAVYDCAMPVAGGVLTVKFDRVIWGKPDWNGYPEFVNRQFFFARPKPGVPVATLPKGLSGKKLAEKKKELKEFEEKRSHFRLYYDPALEPHKAPFDNQDAWVVVSKKQRPLNDSFELFTPFRLTILTTDKDVDPSGRGKGRDMLTRLLRAIPPGKFTLDLDIDYFASIDSTPGFKRKAGSDPEWDLDKMKKRRAFISKNMEKFKKLLIALKRKKRIPAVITIADSTYMTFALDPVAEGQSEYTPVEHAAFIGKKVREIFKEVYGEKVIPRKISKRPPSTPRNARKSSPHSPHEN